MEKEKQGRTDRNIKTFLIEIRKYCTANKTYKATHLNYDRREVNYG